MTKYCGNCAHAIHYKQEYDLCKFKHAIVLIDDYCDDWREREKSLPGTKP